MLGIADGASVRAEVIVSFGNAGARGGSGATAKNIDINSNGVIDPDEASVRSVPTRITKAVPPTEHCNASVTVTDPDLSHVDAGVTILPDTFLNGGIGSGIVITDTASYTVTVDVDGSEAGGKVCNDAFLVGGVESSVQVQMGVDPTTLLPIYYSFPCCIAADLSDCSCVDVPGALSQPSGFHDGQFETFTQQGWEPDPHGGLLITSNFLLVYPSNAIEIGIHEAGGYSIQFFSYDEIVVKGKSTIIVHHDVLDNIAAFLPQGVRRAF